MNITFLLLPKNEIVYLPCNATMRQALEKMEHHHYRAIPLINEAGKYAGTITEGDLLWELKNSCDLNLKDTETIRLTAVPRQNDYTPVKITAKLDELLPLALNQSFVPVIDDYEVFIGIIRPREIITWYTNLLFNTKIIPKDHHGVFYLFQEKFQYK